jgi:hypothetical protein
VWQGFSDEPRICKRVDPDALPLPERERKGWGAAKDGGIVRPSPL